MSNTVPTVQNIDHAMFSYENVNHINKSKLAGDLRGFDSPSA